MVAVMLNLVHSINFGLIVKRLLYFRLVWLNYWQGFS